MNKIIGIIESHLRLISLISMIGSGILMILADHKTNLSERGIELFFLGPVFGMSIGLVLWPYANRFLDRSHLQQPPT